MNSNGDIVGSQSYTTGEVNSIAVWEQKVIFLECTDSAASEL